VLGGMLTLLIFVGEAVRDAFDPRRVPRGERP
jgi:microcin C transport system permease protein